MLAAGAGTRMGGPKALILDAEGVPWVALAVTALADGGCTPVLAVTGARSQQVAALVPAVAGIVVVADWTEGLAASLRAGLRATQAQAPDAVAVVVSLVDTPGVTAEVVARLLRLAGPAALARAGYHGVPGHPVLIGRQHWSGVIDAVTGDRGAGEYLSGHDVRLIESAELASGEDFDTRAAMDQFGRISWAP